MNINKGTEGRIDRPPRRPFEIYLVRHGKQVSYEDPHSPLSEEGEEQARQFAREFVETHRGENIVVKVKRSSVLRASRTGEVIAEELRKIVEEEGLTNIKILNERHAPELRTTGGLAPLLKAGVPYQESVDEWIENEEAYPEAKPKAEVTGQIKDLLSETGRLQERMSPEGPKVIYIDITHETSHAALMHELTGKNTEGLGGGIGHLEAIRIVPRGRDNPTLTFRGEEFVLPLNNEKS